MKVAEFIENTKRYEQDTDNRYASRIVGIRELRDDILEATEDGYIDGITAYELGNDRLLVTCEDGNVVVSKKDGKLRYGVQKRVVYKRFY